MFVISIIIIVIANIHALIFLNIILILTVAYFAIATVIAVFLLPLFLLVYIPTMACLSYSLLFYDARSVLKDEGEQMELILLSHCPSSLIMAKIQLNLKWKALRLNLNNSIVLLTFKI